MPTISFVMRERKSSELPEHLGRRGIGISSGDFYAKRCIDAMGLAHSGGVARISIAHYNSEAEVSRLIEHLANFK